MHIIFIIVFDLSMSATVIFIKLKNQYKGIL